MDLVNKEINVAFEQITQPIVAASAGAMFLGASMEEWIIYGTAVLLVMNLAIKLPQLWKTYFRKDKE